MAQVYGCPLRICYHEVLHVPVHLRVVAKLQKTRAGDLSVTVSTLSCDRRFDMPGTLVRRAHQAHGRRDTFHAPTAKSTTNSLINVLVLTKLRMPAKPYV
jgi:hypothetical protein